MCCQVFFETLQPTPYRVQPDAVDYSTTSEWLMLTCCAIVCFSRFCNMMRYDAAVWRRLDDRHSYNTNTASVNCDSVWNRWFNDLFTREYKACMPLNFLNKITESCAIHFINWQSHWLVITTILLHHLTLVYIHHRTRGLWQGTADQSDAVWSTIAPLQRVQYVAVHIIQELSAHDHVHDALLQFNWLPVH